MARFSGVVLSVLSSSVLACSSDSGKGMGAWGAGGTGGGETGGGTRGAKDGTQDPNQACDAISIGLGFEGKPIQLGSVAASEPAVESPCN